MRPAATLSGAVDDAAFSGELFAALPQGDALRRYIEHGYPTNHFLLAVLENDLMEAVARADDDNLEALEAYCAWLRTFAPSASYGSPDRVAAWIRQRGARGVVLGDENHPGQAK